jgi:copper chaperone CopZ
VGSRRSRSSTGTRDLERFDHTDRATGGCRERRDHSDRAATGCRERFDRTDGAAPGARKHPPCGLAQRRTLRPRACADAARVTRRRRRRSEIVASVHSSTNDGLSRAGEMSYSSPPDNSMKFIPLMILALTGGVLGLIALRAPAPSYVAPTERYVEAHVPAPETITRDVAPGFVVRTFKVDGMCCQDCTGKIYERLKESPGVVDAAVSFDKGIAQVVVPKDADVGSLENAIHFEKYSARALP